MTLTLRRIKRNGELLRSNKPQENSQDIHDKELLTSEPPIYTFFYNGLIVELPTRWLHSISNEPRFSPSSINQYASAVKNWLEWLADYSKFENISLDTAIKAVSRNDLQQWIKSQKAIGIKAATIRNREVILKGFIDWLVTADAGHIRTFQNTPYKRSFVHPTGRLISPKPAKRKPRKFTNEALVLILSGYHNESERCLAHTLYDTGLRISEAKRLRRNDLPDEKCFPAGLKYYPLYIRGSKGAGGQTKERMTIISAPTLARIRRYHGSEEYRFSPYYDHSDPNKPAFLSVNGRELNARNVSAQLKLAVIRAGLDPKEFSPHKFRHGAAYSILQSELGRDYFDRLFMVQQFFGHSNITTTEIYTVIPPSILAKLNKDQVVVDKYEEQKLIADATYLPPRKHLEKRGHLKT